ncbi:MAG: methionine synthase [Chloroflexota bacterium]
MSHVEFNLRPTIIGSMPHTDPARVNRQILRYLKDIPAWAQLPRRSFRENMYAQYSEGFPGVVLEAERMYIDPSKGQDKPLEELYTAYLADDVDRYPVTREYAAGLHALLAERDLKPWAVKGQVAGPVTWGLTVTDDSGRAILYDDVLGDAVPRLLRLKAAWQERQLKRLSANTIIFLDEPYMSAFGSVSVMLSRERVIALLDEVFGGISGLKGVHCCGNTDWPVLMDTTVDIISFDAYGYAQSLGLYTAEVKKFLDRGGTIAWGIVPSDETALAGESASSLKDRLEEAMAPFTRAGVRFGQLVRQGLLTPSCGLASMTDEEPANRALELLAELSEKLKNTRT